MARLTDRSVEALRPKAARYEVWDEARKGFGVRVTPRGVKSFVWVYHYGGRPRRLTFGTYPRLSLADAGVKLAQAKNLLGRGIDPVPVQSPSAMPSGTPRRSRSWLRRIWSATRG